MNNLETSDYYKLRIYYYPSKFIMKKYHIEYNKIINNEKASTKYLKLFNIHIDLMNNFYWKIIENITGFKQEIWYDIYRYDTPECAFEYIWESTDILIIRESRYYTFYIPKKYNEYYDWIINNIPKEFKYKILKRCSIPWFYEDKKNCKYTRERSLVTTKNFLEKIKKYQ